MNKTKKNKIILFVSILIFSFGVCAINIMASEELFSDITYYSIYIEDFENFLDNPSMKILDDNSYIMEKYVVDSSKDEDGNTIYAFAGTDYKHKNEFDDNPVTEFYIDKVFSRDGYIGTISPDNLKYMNKENLAKILIDNGVNEKLQQYALISVRSSIDMPLTVWLKTKSNNNYFLVYEYERNIESKDKELVDFSKAMFMTYDEYKDRYEFKEGRLICNGVDMTQSNKIKFENNTAYIAFDYFLKTLGSTYVIYDYSQPTHYDDKKIFFDINGKKYIADGQSIYLERFDGVLDTSYHALRFYNCRVIDGIEMIYSRSINYISFIYNKKISYDYYTKTVYINDNTDDDINYTPDKSIPDDNDIIVVAQNTIMESDTLPQIIDGRLFVPIRSIGKALDAKVKWNRDDKSMDIENDEFIANLSTKDSVLTVYDKSGNLLKTVVIEPSVKNINKRTMVPIRAISEALGFDVKWNEEYKRVTINEDTMYR